MPFHNTSIVETSPLRRFPSRYLHLLAASAWRPAAQRLISNGCVSVTCDDASDKRITAAYRMA